MFAIIHLFDQFNTAESYIILLLLLIAFLFGLGVGLLLQAGRMGELRKELAAVRTRLDSRDREVETLNEQLLAAGEELRAKETTAGALRQEAEDARSLAQRIEQERNRLNNDLYEAVARMEKLQSTNQTYRSTIEELNHQILGLQSRQEHLIKEQAVLPEPVEAGPDYSEERADNGGEVPDDASAMRHRLVAAEEKMLRLERENRSLLEEIKVLRSLNPEEEEPDLLPEQPEPREVSADAGVERDDLTLISGISRYLEKKLNSLGIYNFHQISSWDETHLRVMAHDLDHDAVRMENEDWVAQARRLTQLKSQDPEAFHRLTSYPQDPEDLQIIEGIDPAVEEALRRAGILTWDDLADATPDSLRAILDEAGEEFYHHDPTTWPIQARLAVNRDWRLLEEYQEQLHDGNTRE